MNLNADITIHVADDGNGTIRFAAEELKKYLELMGNGEIAIRSAPRLNPAEGAGIWIGLSDDVPRSQPCEVEEDEIRIDVDGMTGVIAGSNPRSVLFAVYRYLFESGCRWVRPGADGQYIPRADIGTKRVQVSEKPSYPCRGICIEGAVSLENVVDMMDWLPKIGMNAYFIQFREAHVFFERWYRHLDHPFKQSDESYDVEAALDNVKALVGEIEKRGLHYHAVGHGWTCTALGIPGLGWEKSEAEAGPEAVPYLAMVDGKRQLWDGIALNTELCYSNVESRRRVIEEIIRYASEHPEIDLLHVWLSDGMNNQCECEHCVLSTPTDWYIVLLNDLDEALTSIGNASRIVFLLYQELLWPPAGTRLRNPRRFVLLFAPIARTYRKSFAEMGELPEIPPYVRNRMTLPQSVEENTAFLKEWQHHFQGEGIDFDYHFMWAHQKDPGYVHISRILHQDIQHLHRMGLHGFMSCQVQRSFFPNGLGVTMMGRTLWNRGLGFEQIAEDYFKSAYGEDGLLCLIYLEKLSALFESLDLENVHEREFGGHAAFSQIQDHIRQFGPVIERNLDIANRCHSVSWMFLNIHREIWLALSEALELLYEGRTQEALSSWQVVREKLWEREESCQQVLDVHNFVGVYDGIFARDSKK